MKSGSSNRNKEKPGTQFRDWLIEKVSQARWPVFSDDTDEEIGKRIGVQVDVLQAARVRLRERLAKERVPDGQKLGHRMVYGSVRHRYIFLEPPEKVHAEVEARCSRQQLNPSVLLRSILHRVLQSPTQPLWLAERKHNSWIFKGEWLGAEDIRQKRFRMVTTLGEGADLALRLRAEKTKTPIRAICRWGVCLYIAEQLPKLEIVTSAHAMYKKPEQYCLDPRITT